jgi:TetR/AcrR family transcriptional repressor of nem operon
MNTAALRINDKRDRLIEAARALFHLRGYGETSLADIAKESGVPVGNVYYYFKTKEDIASAVIEQHAERLAALGRKAEQLPDARARIMGMLDDLASDREKIAANGCPMGSLCIEFGKRDSRLRAEANRLLLKIVAWVEHQFAAMGRADAHTLAVQFVSTIQGAGIVALAMRDPAVVDQEIRRLKSTLEAM